MTVSQFGPYLLVVIKHLAPWSRRDRVIIGASSSVLLEACLDFSEVCLDSEMCVSFFILLSWFRKITSLLNMIFLVLGLYNLLVFVNRSLACPSQRHFLPRSRNLTLISILSTTITSSLKVLGLFGGAKHFFLSPLEILIRILRLTWPDNQNIRIYSCISCFRPQSVGTFALV